MFQRPGKFRWSYEKPYEQLIIADGKRLTLFDKDLNQATIRKLQAALPSSPASILFGSNDFEREFEVTEPARATDSSGSAPDRARRTRHSSASRSASATGCPVACCWSTISARQRRFHFSRVERNPKLDADAFRFTPPKGADVLTE